MGSWNATPSKENTVLTDWLTSRLPFWYSRGKGIHLLLWRTPSQCSFFCSDWTIRSVRSYLPSWNATPGLALFIVFYKGGVPKRYPPLPSWNATPGHVLYIYFNLLSNIKLNMFSILSISSSVMFGIDLYNTVIASSCLRVRPLKSLIWFRISVRPYK